MLNVSIEYLSHIASFAIWSWVRYGLSEYSKWHRHQQTPRGISMESLQWQLSNLTRRRASSSVAHTKICGRIQEARRNIPKNTWMWRPQPHSKGLHFKSCSLFDGLGEKVVLYLLTLQWVRMYWVPSLGTGLICGGTVCPHFLLRASCVSAVGVPVWIPVHWFSSTQLSYFSNELTMERQKFLLGKVNPQSASQRQLLCIIYIYISL